MKAKPVSPKGQKKDKLQPRRNPAACADSPREPYRTIFENTGNATILIASDTTIILANSNFADLVGYPREEMEGKMSWTSLIAPEDLPKMRHYHERRRVPGESAPSAYEFGLLTRSGERRDMLITVALIPGTGESVASCMDITDRKRVEKELLQSRESLLKQQAFNQLLLEASPVFIVAIDLDGRLIMMNRAMLEALDYQLEEVQGKDYLSTFVSETDRPALAGVFGRIIHDRSFTFNENRLVGKTGRECLIQWHGRLAPSAGTEPGFFVGIGIDVTERKKAEDALLQSEQRFRDMARLLPESVFEADPQGRLMFVNDLSLERFGYSREDFEQGVNLLDIVAPCDHERALANYLKIVTSGESVGLSEYLVRRKDGTTFPVLIRTTPVETAGKITGTRGVLVDVSEKKAMEDQLIRAQKLESIGTLAGGIAHDFNNLLMGILGNVSLLLMEMDPSQPYYERLRTTEDYIRRGSDLTRQLLGFARGGKYEFRPTNLDKFIRRSAEMFGRTKKEIRIHLKSQDGLWHVDVDRGQMDKVLLNLFVNAWQAMPTGGQLYLSLENVHLKTAECLSQGLTPGWYVRLKVTDTGIGMDRTTRSRIFEPFFSTKDRGRGTGLGLASAYGIIRNHGGAIDVESEKGTGTTFVIHLPASKRTAEEEPSRDQFPQPGRGSVLVIDDEDMILDIASRMLRGLGYSVFSAGSGPEGIRLYERHRDTVDLVLLDMIMPEMSGRETFDALYGLNPDVRVLLCSGYSLDHQAESIMNAGCRGFIQKPFTMAELSEKIQDILKMD